MSYLSEEQHQRAREVVRNKTGADWPELQVDHFEKALSSITLFYWYRKDHVGQGWLLKQLYLSEEEAEFIISGG